MFSLMKMTDSYKLGHRDQFPEGTEFILSNFTPRSSRVPGQEEVVFFALQYFLHRYMREFAHETFFGKQRGALLKDYQRFLDSYLGPNQIGTRHIKELHDLGHMPLRFRALPEGTLVPLKVPMFTVENTHPDFYWLTNYFETLISNVIWKACTSATTAYRMRKLLTSWAYQTGSDPKLVQWQGHDFSYRGMSGTEDAALSGAGHLLSFRGSDTCPATELLQDYYSGEGLIAMSVPATEHSVMCAGGREDELATFTRLLDLYPSGVFSVVSDTWDLWHVLTAILPQLKERIMSREGKLVIRPDSGDPVDIVCGRQKPEIMTADVNLKRDAMYAGVVETLWYLFGGTVNQDGYKVLDPHIGVIYGDGINEERANQICQQLAAKGFASSNVVFGVGSYTYQYVTRDTYGFAMKATWAKINGFERGMFKDPVTDDGGKKSALGRVAVVRNFGGALELMDGLSLATDLQNVNLLQTVWQNGRFVREQTLDEVRSTLWP